MKQADATLFMAARAADPAIRLRCRRYWFGCDLILGIMALIKADGLQRPSMQRTKH